MDIEKINAERDFLRELASVDLRLADWAMSEMKRGNSVSDIKAKLRAAITESVRESN